METLHINNTPLIKLLTKFSWMINILPYYGTADQCYSLMTRLSSSTRLTWLENEAQILGLSETKNDTISHHLERKKVSKNLDDDPFSGRALDILTLNYKFYDLNFTVSEEYYFRCEELLQFLKDIDLKLLSISGISLDFGASSDVITTI